ncbi:GTPase-activating protein gyp8 [Paraconiothyrium brasiliense]|uniref:GTPase-activating protein gyp8 n=1 Tax=Paraconiothyrium brasiliense TaxID=300254 RepID=A0ABR3RVP5_9PLEO
MASRRSSRTPSRSVSSGSLSTRRSTVTAPLSPAEKEKASQISAACHNRDLNALVHLATSTHGLVSDDLRRAAWPILLGRAPEEQEPISWKELPAHRDEGQVALDVNRAFVYYPKNESEKQLDRLKEDLSDIIVETIRRHPTLNYFQGYHDIVQVFLLVLGPHDAPAPVARLSLLRIRDYMLSTLDPAIAQLKLLLPLLETADPQLYDHLPKGQPSFALADALTMFAHHIQDYKDIARLFDFFLARHTVMPIYFFAGVVLSRREELLEIDKEDEDIMHAMLGKLPQPFDVEFHIARGVELYERLPPEKLRSWEWWSISSSSVLKTSTTPVALSCLTLEDGEKWMLQQEKEIRWQQTRAKAQKNAQILKRRLWVYRRQGVFGLAIVVGVYAVWLGRSGNASRLPAFGLLKDLFRRVAGIVR